MSLQSLNPFHIILSCEDIETLISVSCLSKEYYQACNDIVTLNALNVKHNMTKTHCFEDFLHRFDLQYLTKRSDRYSDLDELLELAIAANKMGEVSKFLQKGAIISGYHLTCAARTGNVVMVEMLSEMTGKIYQNEIASGYAQGHHRELLNHAITHRHPGFAVPWYGLFKFKDLDLIIRCLHLEQNFTVALCYAVDPEIIEMIIEMATFKKVTISPKDYTGVICRLSQCNKFPEAQKFKLIEKLIPLSDRDYNLMLQSACSSKNIALVDYFRSLGGKYLGEHLWSYFPFFLKDVATSGDVDLEKYGLNFAVIVGCSGDLEFFIKSLENVKPEDFQELFHDLTTDICLSEVTYLWDHYHDRLTISMDLLEETLSEGAFTTFQYLSSKASDNQLEKILLGYVESSESWSYCYYIKLLIRLGAKNFPECLTAAKRINHPKLIGLFEDLQK